MTKKLEILLRLFKADAITVDEFIILGNDEIKIQYIPYYQITTSPFGYPAGTFVVIDKCLQNNSSTNLDLSQFPMSKTVIEYVKTAKN